MPGGKTKAQLTSEVNALTQKLSSLNVTKKTKKKKKKSKKISLLPSSSFPIPAGYAQPVLNHPSFSGAAEGALRFRHCEFLAKLTILKGAKQAISSITFSPGSSGAGILDSIAKVFDRWVAHKLVVHYRPSVGTTKDGVAIVGIDWDPSDTAPTTEVQVASFYPNGRQPVWGSFDVYVPVDRVMMSRRWLFTKGTSVDKAVFSIQAMVTSTTTTVDTEMGEIWVSYDVELQGPTSLNA